MAVTLIHIIDMSFAQGHIYHMRSTSDKWFGEHTSATWIRMADHPRPHQSHVTNATYLQLRMSQSNNALNSIDTMTLSWLGSKTQSPLLLSMIPRVMTIRATYKMDFFNCVLHKMKIFHKRAIQVIWIVQSWNQFDHPRGIRREHSRLIFIGSILLSNDLNWDWHKKDFG